MSGVGWLPSHTTHLLHPTALTRLRGIPYPTAQTPAADDVAPFHLSAGKCSALILSPLRDRTKAWHMWGDGSGQAGANPWARVSGGAHMCWGSTQAQAAAFFDQVASTGRSGIARRKGHTGGGSVAAWGGAALLASPLTPPRACGRRWRQGRAARRTGSPARRVAWATRQPRRSGDSPARQRCSGLIATCWPRATPCTASLARRPLQ